MSFGFDFFGNNSIIAFNSPPDIENLELTSNLSKAQYLHDKGYCSTYVTLSNNLSYQTPSNFGDCGVESGCGKCSNCTQGDWDANNDRGRTYYLIQKDESDMDLEEGSYLVIGMRQGQGVDIGNNLTLDEAISLAQEDGFCYVIDSVAQVDNGMIRGCTDSTADNYNPDANEDNHSCMYCSKDLGLAYNSQKHICEESCEWWEVIMGCGWFPQLWTWVKGALQEEENL